MFYVHNTSQMSSTLNIITVHISDVDIVNAKAEQKHETTEGRRAAHTAASKWQPNWAALESDNYRIHFAQEKNPKTISLITEFHFSWPRWTTRPSSSWGLGKTVRKLSSSQSQCGHYYRICLLCGRKREQKEKTSSLSIALASPVSFIMVHIATTWAGNHGNCPSQTRQKQQQPFFPLFSLLLGGNWLWNVLAHSHKGKRRLVISDYLCTGICEPSKMIWVPVFS